MTTLLLKQNKSNHASSLVTPLIDSERSIAKTIKDLNNELINLDIGSGIPPVNVYETEGEYIVELVAPGLKKGKLQLEVEEGILSVSADSELETIEDLTNYKRKEFSYCGFSRSFELPNDALEEEIQADYENGIITLLIPKKETEEIEEGIIIEID